MAGVDVSTRECDSQVVVALRGQLDMAEAAGVAAAFTAVAARGPQIIVDLAGLEFIDSSGVAALVRGRKLTRQAGGELLLAAPRQQVLRVLTLTRLVDAFPVHATVAEAAGRSRRVPVLPRWRSLASWPRAAMRSGARALAGQRRQLRKRAGSAEALPRARTAEPASIQDSVRIAWSIRALAGAGTGQRTRTRRLRPLDRQERPPIAGAP